MKAISFELSGKTAFFKKPDVNVYTYFTYNNIHKPALLGLLGAILGLGGYNQQFDKNSQLKTKKKQIHEGFPEYYEKLNKLKVSISPITNHGYFTKKIQVFNNSVGYASKEQGGNLIIREQWLENPKWEILLLDDNSIDRTLFDKLKDYLRNYKTEFIPYLGKNDHPAKISKKQIINLKQNDFNGKITSLFVNKDFILSSFPPRDEEGFLHKEVAPIRLKEKYHFYEYEMLAYTNFKMELLNPEQKVFSFENKNYFFF